VAADAEKPLIVRHKKRFIAVKREPIENGGKSG
jgi:hypothetical protein